MVKCSVQQTGDLANAPVVVGHACGIACVRDGASSHSGASADSALGSRTPQVAYTTPCSEAWVWVHIGGPKRSNPEWRIEPSEVRD